MKSWTAMALAATVATGCGGSSSSPGNLSDACAGFATKLCAQLQRCESGALPVFGYSSVADCVSQTEQWCQVTSSSAQSGFTVGVINACANVRSTESCQAFLQQVDPACSSRGGGLAVGATCLNDWQCSTGRCAGSISGCGTCATQLQQGEPCDVLDFRCADNLSCVVTSLDSSATSCQPLPVLGQSCVAECATGSYCSSVTQRCTALPKVNESCDTARVFFCDLTQTWAECDATTSTCVAEPGFVQPGQACESRQFCQGPCTAQADAGPGICQPVPQKGESCDFICSPGLVCSQGVCSSCDTPVTTALQRASAAARSSALPSRLTARRHGLAPF